MSELLVDFITSLDGYASAEGWPGFWGLEGPEYLTWLNESPEGDYTILMGATTYRLMSGFAASGEEGVSELTAAPKVVFSSTLSEPLEWANTRLVDEDPVAAVRSLKAESTSPGLRTLGSLTLCRTLLEAGLVDRFRVVAFPVITGRTGRERIYDGYPDVALEMIASRTFDGQAAAARVRPHGPDRPTEQRSHHDLKPRGGVDHSPTAPDTASAFAAPPIRVPGLLPCSWRSCARGAPPCPRPSRPRRRAPTAGSSAASSSRTGCK